MNEWVIILICIAIVGANGAVFKKKFQFQIMAIGAILSLFVYSLLAKWIQTAIIVAGICSVLCILCIWCRPIRRNKQKVIRRRLKNSWVGVSNIFTVCMGCCILLSVFALFDIETKTVEETNVVYGEEYSFRSNAETMVLLEKERWEKLTLKEKEKVAQCVAHCEARYFGLWTPLHIEVMNFEDNRLGCYSDKTYTIYISKEHMEKGNASEVLHTILHEAYHAYSHRLIDLYEGVDKKAKNLLVFYETEQYQAEFQNYVKATDNVVGYLTQECEMDANRYANQGVKEYYHMIDEYLEKGGE